MRECVFAFPFRVCSLAHFPRFLWFSMKNMGFGLHKFSPSTISLEGAVKMCRIPVFISSKSIWYSISKALIIHKFTFMIEQYSRAHSRWHNWFYENGLMANNRGKKICTAPEIENMMTIISNQLFIFSSGIGKFVFITRCKSTLFNVHFTNIFICHGQFKSDKQFRILNCVNSLLFSVCQCDSIWLSRIR